MKQSFFSMFGLVHIINDFILTSIGIYLLVCRNTWLGVTCLILGLYELAMTVVMIKKMAITRLDENESRDVTSITVDAK